MRLVHTEKIQVEEFLGSPPDYVILSHTWGSDEVTFQQMMESPRPKEVETKPGYRKILAACERAREDGYSYIWIDTCCIDKTSSSELSEAINSMFKWYHLAEICYVHMVDVGTANDVLLGQVFDRRRVFAKSRWFNRGWTLQELIAPECVEFYASDWTGIGTKLSLRTHLARITKINLPVLGGGSPFACTVAERMSWASYRETTRVEDAAYSLIGLFGISMPLLYGEGRRSFFRLQEEILKTSEDYSVLAWRQGELTSGIDYALADGPYAFRAHASDGGDSDIETSEVPIVALQNSSDSTVDVTPVLTARGLRVHLPIYKDPLNSSSIYEVDLFCHRRSTGERMLIELVEEEFQPNVFRRIMGFRFVHREEDIPFVPTTVFIKQDMWPSDSIPQQMTMSMSITLRVENLTTLSLEVESIPDIKCQKFPWSTELPSDEVALLRFYVGGRFTIFVGIQEDWCNMAMALPSSGSISREYRRAEAAWSKSLAGNQCMSWAPNELRSDRLETRIQAFGAVMRVSVKKRRLHVLATVTLQPADEILEVRRRIV